MDETKKTIEELDLIYDIIENRQDVASVERLEKLLDEKGVHSIWYDIGKDFLDRHRQNYPANTSVISHDPETLDFKSGE